MNQPYRQLLVIDDDVSVRQSIAAYLQDSGYHVHQVSSGQEALNWLENNRPIVVLTDLRMPDVDGLAILRWVRDRAPEVPVIVISGLGVVKDVIDALRLGAADYLVKPIVDMEVLVHAVNRSLERSELILQNHVYRQELEQANRELKEYVRVLERDQKAGRQVQTKLLPDTPASFQGINIDYRMVASLYLSGDFIDYGLLHDRYLAFYLTDVSGHGAASAFVTVWLKQLVRRFFRDQALFATQESFDNDVAKLAAIINREVINSGIGCHMTCFVGVIDTHTNEMRYVFGGHLPFPILITDQGCDYLTGKGKPIGIFPDASWKVHALNLPEEFSIMIFSDGILEILPDTELIDKERHLLDIVRNEPRSVDAIVKALNIDDIESIPDDIAILHVRAEKKL